MSIEEELKELARNMFKERRSYLLDQKPLNDEVAAYVRAKVRETLDRIETHRVDWKEIDGLDPTDAVYLAISRVMDDVQKIRKDLVHQPSN